MRDPNGRKREKQIAAHEAQDVRFAATFGRPPRPFWPPIFQDAQPKDTSEDKWHLQPKEEVVRVT